MGLLLLSDTTTLNKTCLGDKDGFIWTQPYEAKNDCSYRSQVVIDQISKDDYERPNIYYVASNVYPLHVVLKCLNKINWT